jgi:ribonuclease P protein component
VVGAYFVLFGVPAAGLRSRLGITATKKFGDAVARNRIKRVVRELFRHRFGEDAPIDLVVNVKSAAARATFANLQEDFATRLAELRARVRA